jgi:hypothetical protein
VSAEQSRRFVITGQDPEGRNRTVILWRKAEYVGGKVVKRVVLTLGTTMKAATILTLAEVVEVTVITGTSPRAHAWSCTERDPVIREDRELLAVLARLNRELARSPCG